MAYRFNKGKEEVVCDQCKKIIDRYVSYSEYEETYGKSGDDGDYCMMCKMGYSKNKKQKYDLTDNG